MSGVLPVARLAAMLLSVLLAGPALATGLLIPKEPAGGAAPRLTALTAVVIREGADEVLLLQPTYAGPASEAVWLVPVPVRPSEVFAAEPVLIDQLLLHTSPRVLSDVTADSATLEAARGPYRNISWPSDPTPQAGAAHGSLLPFGPAPEALPARERVLAKWLADSGYDPALAGRADVAALLRRGGWLAAARILAGESSSRPLLANLPPLGMRFPAERLVLPLTPSRAGASTAATILVLDDAPVECDELPSAWLPTTPRALRVGETYGAERRRLTRAEGGPRLLCECSETGPVPYRDLGYRVSEWGETGCDRGLVTKHVTRWFGLLEPTEADVLHFRPAPERPRDYRVLVKRHGRLSYPLYEAARREAESNRSLSRRPTTRLEDEVIPVVRSATTWASAPASVCGRGSPPAQAGQPTASRWGTALAGTALLAAAVAAAVRWQRRAAAGIVVLALLCPASLGGDRPDAREEARLSDVAVGLRLVEADIEGVDAALTALVLDTGAYPRSLDDLAAGSAPREGLDSSGSTVPLPEGWRGPYLNVVPSGVLGGGLAYDVLNVRPIDARGWRTEVCGATSAERSAASRSIGFQTEEAPAIADFWDLGMSDGTVDHQDYAAWLAERGDGPLLIGSGGSRSDRGMWDSRFLVADPTRGEFFVLPSSTLSVCAEDGAALSRRSYPFWPGRGWTPEPNSDTWGSLAGLFATAADAPLAKLCRLPVPLSATRASSIASAAIGPDGRGAHRYALSLAFGAMQALTLAGSPAGGFREVARGTRPVAAFSPDGNAMYTEGPGDAALYYSAFAPPDRVVERIAVDGSRTTLATGAAARGISVSRLGVLVPARELRLYPLEGGDPQVIPIGSNRVVVTARTTDHGIAWIEVPVASEGPPSRLGDLPLHHMLGRPAEGTGEIRVATAPGGESRVAGNVRWDREVAVSILGLDEAGAVTVAWQRVANARSTGWVVKSIAPDGTTRVFEERTVAGGDDRAARWVPESGPGSTPSLAEPVLP